MKVLAASLRRKDHAIKLVGTLLFNTHKTASYIIIVNNKKCCNISTNVASNISLVKEVNQQQTIPARLQGHSLKFTCASSSTSTSTSSTTYNTFSLDYLNSLLDNNNKKKETRTCLGKSKTNIFYFYFN